MTMEITADAPFELTRQTPHATPVGVQQVLSMVQAAIDKGISPDAIQKLAELSIQFKKMDAEAEFNADFAAMQAEMPDIVCDKKGPWGGDYADKESMMRQIRPTLLKFGFSVKFNHPAGKTSAELVTECVLAHRSGHSVTNSITTRAGRPNKMMTEIQVDAGGYYAGERYSLTAMLNIRADKADDDARVMGMELTADELNTLKNRAKQVGADVPNLFRQAGVTSWEEIRTGALTLLHNFLNDKERRMKEANKNPTNRGGGAVSQPAAPSKMQASGADASQVEGSSNVDAPTTSAPLDPAAPVVTAEDYAREFADNASETELVTRFDSATSQQQAKAKKLAKITGSFDDFPENKRREVVFFLMCERK